MSNDIFNPSDYGGTVHLEAEPVKVRRPGPDDGDPIVESYRMATEPNSFRLAKMQNHMVNGGALDFIETIKLGIHPDDTQRLLDAWQEDNWDIAAVASLCNIIAERYSESLSVAYKARQAEKARQEANARLNAGSQRAVAPSSQDWRLQLPEEPPSDWRPAGVERPEFSGLGPAD